MYSESHDSEHPYLASAFICNVANFSLLNMSFAVSFGGYSY